MKAEFDVEELGKLIAEWFIDYEKVCAFQIWEQLHEVLVDFEFAVFDSAVEELEKNNIEVEMV